ncbi:uncharacterized protein LOC119446096 [Dermacentor silvarum]|uniref:uncharacterized protein LOC119446096 n=1 Tax=Dermacentor silvarum TaxID=543639 RepID=UPI00189BF275|nr:uncharacterized protein LOC119446096 [Dermacentor silvarum]
MERCMLTLIVLSTGLVGGLHRNSWKNCKRLGAHPTEQKPAKVCWYHCYDEDRNRVHRKLESYGTPCTGWPNRPLGFCWGSHCYQDHFGRRPPWTPPPGSDGPTSPSPTGQTTATVRPPRSESYRRGSAEQTVNSTAKSNSTPYNEAPVNKPK